MRLLVDIGHPGHVHYFRNLINKLKKLEYDIIITARNRGIIFTLLKNYGFKFINRGKGFDSKAGKLFYILIADCMLLKVAYRFKPDIILSFSSPYAAQVAKILDIPNISLNDTEHTDNVHSKLTYPFTDTIITPRSYQNNLGDKQIRLNSLIEWLYLNPEVYKPDQSILKLLGVKKGEEYVILRFVSWKAFHDENQKGLSLIQKKEIINHLNNRFKVFISFEGEIDVDLEKYRIKIPPEKMHDALAYSSLFVGESGTMASECALLGVPTVYINSLPLMCYLKEEQEYGILKHFSKGSDVLPYIKSILNKQNLKKETENKRDRLVEGFINPTEFLVWFITSWPDSKLIMKENPDYQYRFR